ncbi:MAG TPA: ParB/RepB/Spo0J family partition protein [Thermomicrobiales bacterium]|nr:ParB/RepB/Spo0J family partition protein [Thermomicrobiales bacterium]
MTGRRSGLGRGLESLIPGGDVGQSATQFVDVDSLEPNPLQPRIRWDETQLAALADSIREHGIIQPIVVTRGRGAKPYQIIAGERRWRAAQRAGLRTTPVLVREATPSQILEIALVENIQRSDLNPIEEALAYRHLTDEFGLKQSEIAERVGKSRPAIANTMRLLTAPAPIREAVANEDISAGHARALLAVDEPGRQVALLELVLARGLSVRETEALAQRSPAPKRPARPRTVDVETRAIERELQRAFGTNVAITRGKDGGRITISFHSDEELNAILGRMLTDDELV